MKKIVFSFFLLTACQISQAQTLKDILKEADKILNEVATPQNNQNQNGQNNGQQTNTNNNQNQGGGILGNLGNGLSNTDVVSGLREALKIGAQNASSKLNVTNGFFGNQLIKIMMPAEAQKVEATLRQFGFGRQCDKLIMSLNRAAEDAAGKAVPIFVNAIMHINLNDGLNILRGGNNAATTFLRTTTTQALTQAFRPVIQNSLGKVNAPNLWRSVFNTYNKLSAGQKVNTDLTGYVTERALAGLFTTVAQEEANIRNNPAARVTSLLQKVFGG